MANPAYRRAIVKVSGECLLGVDGASIDQSMLARIAADIAAAHKAGTQIGVVIGGGNIFRGVKVSAQGIPRQTGDSMGMLATVMNALALEVAIEQAGVAARTLSALAMPQLCETYERRQAVRHLDGGRVVLLAGGTANPFF
ncbi:MAG TPA: UMP kinase, partial [Xanthobacteraceae bacterium]